MLLVKKVEDASSEPGNSFYGIQLTDTFNMAVTSVIDCYSERDADDLMAELKESIEKHTVERVKEGDYSEIIREYARRGKKN